MSCWRNTLSVTVAGAQAEGGEQGLMGEDWELSSQSSPEGGEPVGVLRKGCHRLVYVLSSLPWVLCWMVGMGAGLEARSPLGILLQPLGAGGDGGSSGWTQERG